MNEAPNETPPLTGQLRPVRPAFLFQRVAPGTSVILVVTGVAAVAVGWIGIRDLSPLWVVLGGLGLALLWVLGAGFWANACYAKERYEFLDHRIIAHRGSPISDQTSELTIRNITHVKRRLPWPRYPLFGVGDVMVESAGSQASEITLRTIHRPDHVYESLASLMRANGFRLSRNELLHEEQPDTIAVTIECFGMVLATLFATFAALAELYFEDNGGSPTGGYLGLTPMLGIVAVGFHFLDMRRRTYRVYSDSVFYEEGFLTRDDAFIPGENIADSSMRRGLIDLLVGVYDVQISCQGSQGEIHFRRLRNGPALSGAVERLISETPELSPATDPEAIAAEAVPGDVVTPEETALPDSRVERAKPAGLSTEERWTAELRPKPLRAAMPAIVLLLIAFPLLPLWVIIIVREFVNAACTTYCVRRHSVREHFQFLHTKEREFNYDKITGLVIRENPLDKMFATVTVSIWSIGSPLPLKLAHVNRHELQMNPLLRQIGIPKPDALEQIPARFSLKRMVLATLPIQAILAAAVIASLVLSLTLSGWWLTAWVLLAVLAACVVAHRCVYYPRCGVTVHAEHLECREGWLWRRHYFVRHDNVKRLELTRYPCTDVGTVRFVVAGERRQGSSGYATRKKKKNPLERFGASSYCFGVRYAEGISRFRWSLDERLRGVDPAAVAAEVTPESESGPAVANALTGLIVLSIVIVPLVVLLPVSIPILVLAVRRRRYIVEPHRVLLSRGIVYRRHASILHDRIDSIRRNQHVFGKLFGNGNVTIFTAGSSRPDMRFTNAPDYLQLFELIQRHYQN